MGVALVGVWAPATQGTSSSIAVPKIAGVQPGDLLIAHVARRSNLTPPAGWSLVTGLKAPVFDQWQDIYQRRVTAADPETETWAVSAFGRFVVAVTALRGAELAGFGSASGNGSAFPHRPPAVTLAASVTDAAVLTLASCVYAGSASTMDGWAAPAGNALYGSKTGDRAHARLSLGHSGSTFAGADLSHTDGTTHDWVSTSLVLAPAGSVEEPPPVLGLTANVAGTWTELPVKVYVDGRGWVRAYVRRYGDPGWLPSEADRIDAATDLAGIQRVLDEAAADYGVTVTISQSVAGSGSYTSPTTVDDGYIQTAAKAFVAALRQHPLSLFRTATGAAGGWKFFLGRTLMVSGAEVSGVYSWKTVSMNTDVTDYALQTMLDDRYHNAISVIHHEVAHGLWEQKTGAQLDTFKSEMAAAQPPGFTWLGASARTAPFEGEHPVGFPRAYGRTNANEDQADIIGWLLTAHLWQRDGDRWFGADQYLAAKAAAARKWLTSLGVTGLT